MILSYNFISLPMDGKETLDIFLRANHRYFLLPDLTEFLKSEFSRVIAWFNLKEECINLKLGMKKIKW